MDSSIISLCTLAIMNRTKDFEIFEIVEIGVWKDVDLDSTNKDSKPWTTNQLIQILVN